MANQADPFASAASQTIEWMRMAPGDARAGMAKAEALAGEIQTLPLYEHLTQIIPAADVVFGGGMLLLVVMVHAAGLRLASNRFERHMLPLREHPSSWRPDLIMGVAVGQMLVLHLIEIIIWSAALVESGLVADWRVSGFFAANTYTTVGYGAFVLPPGWHMLAPIIAMSGLFTFGWTGSVLVEIVRRCQAAKALVLRSRRRGAKGPAADTPPPD
jgi:hypothetical protein